MSDQPSTPIEHPNGNAEELRAQRIWLITNVMAVTWAFFAIYLFASGYPLAGKVGFAECLVYLGLVLLFRRSTKYRLLMELWLVACGIGVVMISTSDPAIARTIFYFPISIVVASQLFGVRQALVWLVASVIVMVAVALGTYGLHEPFFTWRRDELILSVGTAVCLYFCVQQAEAHYQAKTKGLVQLSSDLGEQAQQLEVLATTDSLTGLSNRFQFQRELAATIEHCNDDPMTLFLIDMDGFKEVNDTLGHQVGDDVLAEIGRRLSDTFGARSKVSRLGGDEFCVICTGVGTNERAEVVANEMHDLLVQRYCVDENELCLGASIGYAIAPQHANADQDLLAFADTAMFCAKEGGLKYICYDRSMTESLSKSRVLKAKLAPALSRNEFFLTYQPQIDINSGQMVGVEALIRWKHEGKIISPIDFIPLLEQTGRITEVGKWIIREGIRQQALWAKDGVDVKMSINLSAVQFRDSDLVCGIESALNEFGVNGSRVDFEITEGMLLDDIDQTIDVLHQIKQLGSSISIDDFGTGYSSLSYLGRLPIDRLKVDRAFIKDVPDADDGSLVGSIISLGETLGVTVLVEGVETDEQLDLIHNYGCDEYQGYYLSPPVSPAEIASIYENLEGSSDNNFLANPVN